MVFWQSARTRKQAKPRVATPTARAAGVQDLAIVIDSHERYAFTFSGKPVNTTRKALSGGDYGIERGGRLVATVERKSLADLVASLTSGKLKFALAELAALPRAAVVVEDRYSQVFAQTQVRPAVIADGLAELQVRWPNVPIVFCETRKLAEEWVYRYLAAAQVWYEYDEAVTVGADSDSVSDEAPASRSALPSAAEIRDWARSQGMSVPDRGRLRPEVIDAWRRAKAEPTDDEDDSN